MTAQFRPRGPRVTVLDSADGWEKLDTVYYVLPAGGILLLPKAVVKACRYVDPGYMLLAVRNVYRDLHSRVHYFDRYVTALGDDGSRLDVPHPDFRRYPIRYPYHYKGLRPHEILDIWEGAEVVKGLPGPFMPFDWAQYEDVAFFAKRMEALRDELASKEKRLDPEALQKRIHTMKAEGHRRTEQKLWSEISYRFDHDEAYHKRLVDHTGHSDFKEVGLA